MDQDTNKQYLYVWHDDDVTPGKKKHIPFSSKIRIRLSISNPIASYHNILQVQPRIALYVVPGLYCCMIYALLLQVKDNRSLAGSITSITYTCVDHQRPDFLTPSMRLVNMAEYANAWSYCFYLA